MAETRITGRSGAITITGDGYGFGSIQTGPPILPEPPRQEDRKLDRAQLKKKFGASDEELAEIMEIPGFPAPASKTHGVGSWVVTPKWSERGIDRFVADKRADAEKTLRLLG